MTWLWAFFGFSSLGLLSLFIWWLVHLGKQIAKGEEASRREGLLKKDVSNRNQFLKDVDRLEKEKEEVKREARKAFSHGTVGDLVRVLNRARGVPKVPTKGKPKSSG